MKTDALSKTPWLKTALVACALLAAAAASSMAATQVQTNTLDCGASGSDFTFAKFNTSLGTLTGINLTASGTDNGSFTITNNLGTPDQVNNPKDTLISIIYQNESSNTQYLAINKTLHTGDVFPYDIAGGQQLTFTLNGTDSFTPYSDLFTDGSRWLSYEGTGNAIFTVSNSPQVTTTGGFYTANTTGIHTNTKLTLTYTYDVTPVPEPSTWAGLGAALGGLFLIARSARRKTAIAVGAES